MACWEMKDRRNRKLAGRHRRRHDVMLLVHWFAVIACWDSHLAVRLLSYGLYPRKNWSLCFAGSSCAFISQGQRERNVIMRARCAWCVHLSLICRLCLIYRMCLMISNRCLFLCVKLFKVSCTCQAKCDLRFANSGGSRVCGASDHCWRWFKLKNLSQNTFGNFALLTKSRRSH